MDESQEQILKLEYVLEHSGNQPRTLTTFDPDDPRHRLAYFKYKDGTLYDGIFNKDFVTNQYYTGKVFSASSVKLIRLQTPIKMEPDDVKKLPTLDSELRTYENSFVGTDDFSFLLNSGPDDPVDKPLEKLALMAARAMPMADYNRNFVQQGLDMRMPNGTVPPIGELSNINVIRPSVMEPVGIETIDPSILQPNETDKYMAPNPTSISNRLRDLTGQVQDLIRESIRGYNRTGAPAYQDVTIILVDLLDNIQGTPEEQIIEIMDVFASADQQIGILNYEYRDTVRDYKKSTRSARIGANLIQPELLPTIQPPTTIGKSTVTPVKKRERLLLTDREQPSTPDTVERPPQNAIERYVPPDEQPPEIAPNPTVRERLQSNRSRKNTFETIAEGKYKKNIVYRNRYVAISILLRDNTFTDSVMKKLVEYPFIPNRKNNTTDAYQRLSDEVELIIQVIYSHNQISPPWKAVHLLLEVVFNVHRGFIQTWLNTVDGNAVRFALKEVGWTGKDAKKTG